MGSSETFTYASNYGCIVDALRRKGFDNTKGFNYIKAAPGFICGSVMLILFFGSAYEHIQRGQTSESLPLIGSGIIIMIYCVVFIIIRMKSQNLLIMFDEFEDLTNICLNDTPNVRKVTESCISLTSKLVRFWMIVSHSIPLSFPFVWLAWSLKNTKETSSDSYLMFDLFLPGGGQFVSPYSGLLNVFLTVSLFFVANGHGGWTGLIYSHLIFVRYQFDALFVKIVDLFKDVDQNNYEHLVMHRLSSIVRWHQRIMEFTTLLENTFSLYIALIQIYSAILMCLCFFIILNIFQEGTGLMQSFAVLPVNALMTFTLCKLGSDISHSSKNIAVAVYKCKWECFPSINIRRSLMMLMLRSQIPVQVIGIGLVILNLSTFVVILKSAYTYFTFLRSM